MAATFMTCSSYTFI